MRRVLVLDDEIDIIETISGMLRDEGFEVDFTSRSDQIMAKIGGFQPNLITLDLKWESKESRGIEILKEIRARYSKEELPIIIISGHGDAIKLTELIKLGMNGYMFKPINNSKDLVEKIEPYFVRQQKPREPEEALWKKMLVGESTRIMELILDLGELAQAEQDTLILGETGTGKTLIAEIYHQLSPRAEKEFYRIDAATFTDELINDELFGHASGAFSDAKSDRKGKTEAAQGGILFFDEIGELSPRQQQRLLTLWQSKSITPIGTSKTVKLDILLLAATNKNLYEMVKKGEFRKDLYYRLHKHILFIPALRERKEDIPLLVRHFIKKYEKLNRQVVDVEKEVYDRFIDLPWEGNIRQLEHCIQVGLTKGRGVKIAWKDVEPFFKIQNEPVRHIPDEEGVLPGDFVNLDYSSLINAIKQKSETIKEKYIRFHLRQNQYDVSKTAAAVGIKHRQQLDEIIKKLNITPPQT